MENNSNRLLFSYIKMDALLEGEGINYTDEYSFCFKVRGDQYILYGNPSDKMTALKGPYKKYEYLTAIKAVVGENGTGKTVLLQTLMNNGCIPDWIGEKYKGKTKYYIFVIEISGKKHIRYCLPGKKLVIQFCNIRFKEENLDPVLKDAEHKTIRKKVSGEGMFPNTTKIYLTNSMYVDWASVAGKKGMLTDIAVSAGTQATIAEMYYKNLFDLNDSVYTLDINHEWNRILLSYVNSTKFRSICDVRYLYMNISSNAIFRSGRTIHISYIPNYEILFHSDNGYLNKKEWRWGDPWRKRKKDGEDERNTIRYKIWKNVDQCRDIYSLLELSGAATPESILYINLIFELYGCLDEEIKKTDYKSVDELDKDIEKIIAEKRRNKTYISSYFSDALDEIRMYKGIGDRTFSYSENREEYIKVLELLNKSYDKEESGRVNSFVLRYIDIREQPMSSGERAMLNFYSWVILFKDFNKILGNNLQKLMPNILLMIDEIDLYLHPEWQRTFLKEFLDNLQEILPEKKIQLIITTHSPLCLSDFNKESVTYISKNETGSTIEAPEDHDETLARDIYTLLDDGFYLQGSMGAIASEYIRELIERIKKLEKDVTIAKKLWSEENPSQTGLKTELEDISDKLSILGNDIIRNGLQTRVDLIKGELV